ncbi:hypothetical protein JQ616_28910 [Bradyrhizobium tropiciagri]|uniref:hypothetical protein n=1 Tax=Bradyrhizobium tropiciagri TaxID=312253 RepID=UPI001BAB24AC|nr:hypothetical protein [Bradyrhizobium tropiciagri]MBR0898996.1 hypothetical protein [Bradyrhizobium tropiciagri]
MKMHVFKSPQKAAQFEGYKKTCSEWMIQVQVAVCQLDSHVYGDLNLGGPHDFERQRKRPMTIRGDMQYAGNRHFRLKPDVRPASSPYFRLVALEVIGGHPGDDL